MFPFFRCDEINKTWHVHQLNSVPKSMQTKKKKKNKQCRIKGKVDVHKLNASIQVQVFFYLKKILSLYSKGREMQV